MTSIAHPPLIDTHCHLDFEYDGKDAAQLVEEARLKGIQTLITIGTTVEGSSALSAIADAFDSVYFTVGVHPHDTKDVPTSYLEMLRASASHGKCKAIGEIGLDYYYNHSDASVQTKRLAEQLELANDLGLPVVIHSRDAEDELYEALARYCKARPPSLPPGVIHCFSGTQRFGEQCLELGFYLSFSGIITFKKSAELRTAAQAFPLHRILVETDAPFLAPEPMRGKKCEPSMIVHTAQRLAQIHGVTFEEMAKVTTDNAKTLFSLT